MKIFPAGVHVKIGVAGLAGRIQAQLFMVVDLVTANCAGLVVNQPKRKVRFQFLEPNSNIKSETLATQNR